jgi:transglutaminase-like putative cysteine protease
VKFKIRHVTIYRYDRPVVLGRHFFRMQPRRDGYLSMDSFALSVNPPPVELRPSLDLEGNLVHVAYFSGETQELRISFRSAGETHPRPLFAPLLDAGGLSLPVAYGSLSTAAGPSLGEVVDASVRAFAESLAEEAGRETLPFLDALNRRLRDGFLSVSRPTGDPLEPGVTLTRAQGSCRDLAVLFIAACRVQGIAARFVSGYIPAQPGEKQSMHAWAEVFLPGAGWCAFDPTQGTTTGERHVAVAAASEAAHAAPVTGFFTGTARSEMEVDLKVEAEGL